MEGAFLRTGMDTLNKKNQASSKGTQIFFFQDGTREQKCEKEKESFGKNFIGKKLKFIL